MFSTNCMEALLLSNWVYKGKHTKKLNTAENKAAQRTQVALSSRPKAKIRTPKTIGVQIARLNIPMACLFSKDRFAYQSLRGLTKQTK
jgi:hypothetical protein